MTHAFREACFELTAHGTAYLRGTERLLAYLVAEETDFVRWNRGRVRQPMTIRQAHLTLTLVDGSARDSVTVSLSGDPAEDRGAVERAVRSMRAELPALPEDPYLLYSSEPSSSERIETGTMPSPPEMLDAVLGGAEGTDLVGLSASGPIVRAFASSLGHRHYHEVSSFQLDWSLYHSTDKAVASAFSTREWSSVELRARMDAARVQLEHLARPAKTITPGTYRAYLAPAAIAEIVTMLNWGGVSAKAQRTKTSCLQKLVDGEAVLSPKVSLSENAADGLSPSFDEVGFTKPGRVELVTGGRHVAGLVAPRTAREYGVPASADPDEAMRSADIAAGALPRADVLAALGTGVYVGNLWYLNFSDRAGARITGMTRFATFWVERGQIVAPLAVMRFDDSLYRMLGDELVDLTRERDFTLSTNTYGHRSVETTRLPGALLSGLSFTL